MMNLCSERRSPAHPSPWTWLPERKFCLLKEHTVASSPSEGIGWRENSSVVSESAAQEATELEKLGRWRDGVHRGHTLLALSSYLKQEGK